MMRIALFIFSVLLRTSNAEISSYKAAPYSSTARDSFHGHAPHYEFNWGVKDGYYNNYGQYETREGDYTKGFYWIGLPDGRIQTVDYYVDKHYGFIADVKYEIGGRPSDYKPTKENLRDEANRHSVPSLIKHHNYRNQPEGYKKRTHQQELAIPTDPRLGHYKPDDAYRTSTDTLDDLKDYKPISSLYKKTSNEELKNKDDKTGHHVTENHFVDVSIMKSLFREDTALMSTRF